MKTVGVIFGGKSVEHEVSVITGMQVMENLNKNKYNIIPIFISKNGEWFSGNDYKEFRNFKKNEFKDSVKVQFSQNYGDTNLYTHHDSIKLLTKKIITKIDVIFNALHGTNGEDGSVQSIFETIGLPYTGAGIMASAVGMDKVIMKDVYKSKNIPVVKYESFYRSDYKKNSESILNKIKNNLKYPLFVKPSNLGSSIGITRVENEEGLKEAIMIAINYDKKIIIEEAVVNARELNCAVMGYENHIEVSVVEEPLGWEEILSFEDKYIKSNSKGSKTNIAKRHMLEDSEGTLTKKVQELAIKAFTAIDCSGNARIDLLLDADENIYVNEINTLPGSFAFYLWEDIGYSATSLLDKMIDIAFKINNERTETTFSYDANLFNRITYGSKLSK